MIKRETKELDTETCPGEGVVKAEKFPNIKKPFHQRVCGKFWNLGKQHNQKEFKKKKKNSQIMRLATTSSGEVAWMLESASSKQGLNREALNAGLGWGQGLHALRTI